ncbi:peptide chain release factor N(5)-glutamine methyltransferase [Staphylococcus simiae]|uniref:peptide chain release factor N(5)-glutamine methyltransferase n=1 Tax=Staphylococcus simiae TaxID=308354 RepID=UPI001A96FE11|nr:peptide chain release factor N(5)-glutamine methyltransferase [Staphylococcus simiae]MBO1199173.1 peptide chain release factor N(5)-glutamine methyltransferase [Staphylococcus simiae]MBO1201374.1 peptide chain release factor N(5)-glutamine methyltransferase [Staphylococcus simiae]MBO1203522.1 peptide chain release factor N(5)-glutamine methyltransferase [Staphylococcus simiae]MBO1211050.1 peptide chain release factor N(5)-glutamine methyltransferase [Staphylococcus simiae]MBO1229670.1 pepti
MVNYKDKLDEAIHLAQQKGYEQTRAEWLLLDVFHWTRTDFVVHMYDEMSKTDIMKFDLALQRMLIGEPIQYIVGFASFYGRDFEVNSNCLIPRPETEEVMVHFLKNLKNGQTVADIGTGSGALAVSMAKEQPDLQIIATDLSLDALQIARCNAEKHKVDIQFLHGDALKPLIAEDIKLDGLISNPPYIAKSEMSSMESTVTKFEPHQALFAEHNGYAVYESIIDDLPLVMKTNGVVVFEIGYQQGTTLKNIILQKYPDKDVHIVQDINGHDRIVSFKW